MSQQSQCAFLEEVVVWDKQKCLDNLDSALPRIILKLEESAYIEESTGILKIICHSFLPCVPSEELEKRVFSRVCKLTCGVIDGALSKISLIVKSAERSATEDVKSVVVECLEWLMDTVSCIEGCVRHVLSISGSVELSCVQSLPFCAVHALREAYTHCKSSTDLYGDLLEHIGKPLSDLFKRTHSLQMSLVKMLDKICITGAKLEDHVQVLCSVCTGLFEICGVATCLDVKLVISLWKAIVKVCSQHINLLRDRFDVCPLINLLCEEIKQGYKYLFELCPGADSDTLGDDKTFTKTSKILGFQMKVIVALLRDFTDYLGNCESNVLNLLLFLHRYLPPSLSVRDIPVKLDAAIRIQIVNATTPILGYLVGSRAFRSALTTHTEERTSDDRLPQLLIQLMVLDMLPKYEADVMHQWLPPNNHTASSTTSLLSAIFVSIQQCEVEMRIPVTLPGVMVAGKPLRQVSLYEHTVTHICAFIGACPAKLFHVLEHTLLENVLQDSHLLSVVAIDCWCFLVRYGTASVCRDQVQFLMLAYKQLCMTGRQSAHKLKCLIQRLIKFMSQEHQSALLKQFSPHDDPHLWVALTTSCLVDDLAVSVRQSLIAWGLSILQGTEVKALEVFKACKLFTDILGDCSMTECMSRQQQILLINSVCNIWTQIHNTPLEQGPIREQLVVSCLLLTKYLLHGMELEDILKVLTVIQVSIKSASNSDVALATSLFLSGFATLRITPSFQQSQVLYKLQQIFYALMTHPDPLVHHRALETFVQFATQTVHEEVITACIQGNEILNMKLEHFQNKIPYQSSHKKQFVLVQYLKTQVIETVAIEKRDTANSSDTTNSSDVKTIQTQIDRDNKSESLRPADTADMVDEGMDESTSVQPSKRARLSLTPDIPAPHDMEVNSQTAAVTLQDEATGSSKYQIFLNILSTLAKDIEQEYRESAPPPQWFLDAARETVTRIHECINPRNTWFDRLS